MRGHRLLLSFLVAVPVSAGGCLTEPCDAEARPSVVLSVVDAETGEDVDAMVTFLLDGEGPQAPEEGWPGTYVLTSEVQGTFEVTIAAEGYVSVTKEYVVTGDACHPTTVEDELALEAAP